MFLNARPFKKSHTVVGNNNNDDDEPIDSNYYIPTKNYIIPFDMKPMCESGNFFGRSMLFDLPRRAYYETICPLHLNCPALTFQNKNLNLAVSWVQKYLETKDSSDWFHIMVRALAIPSFLEQMDKNAAEFFCYTLPFACWCDGGRPAEQRCREHKHLIIFSYPKGIFKEVIWNNICVPKEERPYYKFKCILSKKIQSPMHLVNTIGYLSNRKSRCNFTFEEKRSSNGMVVNNHNNHPKEKKNWNHFMIQTALPVDYKLVLATQWDNGIMELIHQEYIRVNPNNLLKVPMVFLNSRWQIKVGDLPKIRLNLQLPVSNFFQPTPFQTDYFLHLAENKRIYFTHSLSRPPPPPPPPPKNLLLVGPSTTTTNFEHLLLFYNVVKEEYWVPSKYQQKYLNIMKPIFDRNNELEKELVSLKEQLKITERENSTLKPYFTELENEIGSLNKKIEMTERENSVLKSFLHKSTELEKELGSLKEKLEMTERENNFLKQFFHKYTQLEKEIDSGKIEQEKRKLEMDSLNEKFEIAGQKIQHLEMENKTLLKKINEVYEIENARLKEEIKKLIQSQKKIYN